MKFFVDIVEIDVIVELNDFGMVDGVIINLFLIKKFGCDILEVICEIVVLVDGFVLVEVVVLKVEDMIVEGCEFVKIVDNIVVKVLLIWDGLKVCNVLLNEGKMVNVILCFLVN